MSALEQFGALEATSHSAYILFMHDTWIPVLNYEGLYEVSSAGQVRSVERVVPNSATSTRRVASRILTPHVRGGDGYRTVKLSNQSKMANHYVHRLVATAFHGPGPMRHEVRHLDGDKGNNAATNLAWGTRLENVDDRSRLDEIATGERHGMAKLTERQVLAILSDPRENYLVAAEYGVSDSLVSMIRKRRVWRHLASG